MAADPIIEGIHKVREEYAKRFGNDLRAIVEDARTRQGQNVRKVVQGTPKPASTKGSRDAAA